MTKDAPKVVTTQKIPKVLDDESQESCTKSKYILEIYLRHLNSGQICISYKSKYNSKQFYCDKIIGLLKA